MRPTKQPYRPEGLAQRLSRMERQIADLYRRQPQSRGGSPGTKVDSFVFNVPVDTVSAVTNQDVGLDAEDSLTFYTAGVSISGNTVSLPIGVWLLGMTLFVDYASGLPTSGDITFRLNTSTFLTPPGLGFLDWEDIADFGGQYISGSLLYYPSSSFDVSLFTLNDLDVGATVQGHFWGVEVPIRSVTT